MMHGWSTADIGVRLSWRDLKLFIEQSGRRQESALYRERHPTDWWWDHSAQLTAAVLHALQGANWQRARGRGPRPKMFEPPKVSAVVKPPPRDVEAEKLRVRDELAERRRRLLARKRAG